MSVINKRNAVLGWATWMVAKQAAKRKAANVAAGTNGNHRGRKLAAVPLVLAAVGGAVVFWRRQQDDAEND